METIGDAYMVVGGVPVPVESHAQRVANFALGMRISAEEVMNPVTGEPIQVGGKGALHSRQNITHESKALVCSGRLGVCDTVDIASSIKSPFFSCLCS